MLSPRNFAFSFAIAVLSVALSGCATNPQIQLSEADATCKQARNDANFMQQLAASDGGTNPYLDAPVPRTCKNSSVAAL